MQRGGLTLPPFGETKRQKTLQIREMRKQDMHSEILKKLTESV
jgi:uncharacterized protein YggU (UPF0235/DUF167 family)